MKLKERLLEQAKQDKLAHFYILEPTKSSVDAQADCEQFCHDFFKDYFALKNVTPPENVWNHADIFTLGTRTEEEEISNNFNVEEALAFMRYFEFNPINSPHKFAVITQASRITTIVANKWLKLLEEPSKNTTIILINSNRIKLLDTITSRGILLRLETENKSQGFDEFIGFVEESKNLSLSEFLEKNQKNQKDLNYWVNQLLEWEASRADGALEKAQLGPWLIKLKEMDTFHQPGATKWSAFYQLLHSSVFNRLIH